MKRKDVRELMMQILYQMEMQQDYSVEVFKKAIENKNLNENNQGYMEKIYDIVTEQKEGIDNTIKANLKEWTMDRVSKVDLSILRLAVCEILHIEDIPLNVSINEAVELAKKFSDDQAPKFINGVLGNVKND